jgi:bifunctional polynucleotide phosphatase/kinase
MSYRIWSTLDYQKLSTSPISSLPVAGFDMDGTLIKPFTSTFARNDRDYMFLSGCIERLKLCVEEGYQILIVTNQKFKGSRKVTMENRCNNVFNDIVSKLQQNAHITMVASFEDDIYRKPNVGVWNLLRLNTLSRHAKDLSFFCGDADGSPHSHSDSDKMFAYNLNITFYSSTQPGMFTVI